MIGGISRNMSDGTISKKEKIVGIEFVRAMFATGIVCYHFACHSAYAAPILYRTKNAFWGHIIVMGFFLLSGGMLYLNDHEVKDIKKFYVKRMKSIFPLFYIAFLFFFFLNVIQAKKLFYGPSPWTMFLSVIGMDGYLLYLIPNYYTIGEWFLGAIIIVYLLYPLLVKLMEKHPAITMSVITILFLLQLLDGKVQMEKIRLPFTCIFPFAVGILLFKYKKVLDSNITLAVSGVLFLLFWLVYIPVDEVISTEVSGITLFIILYRIGNILTGQKAVAKVSGFLGALSYPVFLVQHQVVVRLQLIKNPVSTRGYVVLLAASVAVSFFASWILKNVYKTGRFLYNKIYVFNK